MTQSIPSVTTPTPPPSPPPRRVFVGHLSFCFGKAAQMPHGGTGPHSGAQNRVQMQRRKNCISQ